MQVSRIQKYSINFDYLNYLGYNTLLELELVSFFTVAPNIVIPPKSIIALDPNGISFTCRAEGFPRPTISWLLLQNAVVSSALKNDTDFTVTFDNDSGTQQVTSVLTVASVRPSLAGEVICYASNAVSHDSQSVTLTVKSKFPCQN